MTDDTRGGGGARTAGWYDDPDGAAHQRWYDGERWTDHVQDAVPQYGERIPERAWSPERRREPDAPVDTGPDTGAARPVADGAAASAPRAARGVTRWASAIAFLPLIPLAAGLLVDWPGIIAASAGDLEAGRLPVIPPSAEGAYSLVQALGLLVWGASLALALLDRRELIAQGIERPFHWAWGIISPLVYLIGRAVVGRRRGATGMLAPIWTYVGIVAADFIITLARMVAGLAALPPGQLPGT